MKRPNGYISLPMLFFLLLLLVIALGAGAAAFYMRHGLTELQQSRHDLQFIELAKQAFIKAIAEDPSPETDSLDDPVCRLTGTVIDGYTLTIEDVSSRLPLNWINLNILENSALSACLLSGVSIQQFSDFREAHGYETDLQAAYGALVSKIALKDWFTAYGWVNLNVGAEEVLGDIYQFRTGSSGDTAGFKSRVRQKFISKELWKVEDQALALGAGAKQVYPLINAFPMMNINFAPAEVISAVIAYPFPDAKIENASAIAASLVAARDGSAVSPTQFKSMIPIKKPQQERVFSYLGCRSWFWRIGVSNGNRKWGLIVAVVPDLAKTLEPSNKGQVKLIRIINESQPESELTAAGSTQQP